jgi:WhiB family redox-sensing transcriptional regulator
MSNGHVVDLWSEGEGVFRPDRPKWQEHARCRGMLDLFFNEGSSISIRKAKEICALCPVRKPCLQFALDNEEYGVWAGTTTVERGRRKPNKPRRRI